MKKIMGEKEKGITLVALVVTIIVLIILAVISINATLGEDGIIKRAEKAKQQKERAEIIENAKLDIATKLIDNKGSIQESDLVEILTSDKYKTEGTLSDNGETSVLDKTLTTKDGKYEIPVKEIYDGNVVSTSKLITFTVVKSSGVEIEFTVEEGTTWREWVLSYVAYEDLKSSQRSALEDNMVPPLSEMGLSGDYIATVDNSGGGGNAVAPNDAIETGVYYTATVVVN